MIFRFKKPGLIESLETIVANLVYDSLNEPLPQGVRRSDVAARQAGYEADDLRMDVKIQALDEETIAIVGQLTAQTDDGPESARWLPIALNKDERIIKISTTNQFGEFLFEGLPHGVYELRVLLSDKVLRLPPIQSQL